MTTTLIIIRHAKAADSHLYPDDGSRPLVEEGRQKHKELGNILKSKDIHPKVILSSPLLRAKQSAEILSEILGVPWKEERALSPIFDSDKILSLISKDETVIIVGHIPTLEIFTQQLTNANCLPLGLSKSSAVHLEFPEEIGYGKADFVGYYHG